MTLRRRRWRAALVAATLAAAAANPLPAAGAEGFSDVGEGDVHAPAIDALTDQGVFADTECGNGLFCPDDPIDRWVMAVWLIRVLGGEVTDTATSRFDDVDASDWWSTYAEELADRDITTGCKTDPLRYCPDQPVTRAQMATFLHRALVAVKEQVTEPEPVTISDDVPDVDLVDISTGETVKLRSFVTGDKPLLLWFLSPF